MLLQKKYFIKVFLPVFLILIIGLALWQWELITYGWAQARGQWRIIREAREVEEMLQDPAVPDSIKQKLILVQEIRKFAIDSLGVNDSENYTTFFDQRNDPLMYVVTASEPYRLQAKQWPFPLIGTFSYKGFFEKEMAEALIQELETEGFDVSVRNPGGWSTLGYFRDPILSNMIYRGEGRLAETIIHELTHATIFVKDSLTFNENLATFIGEEGARKFLAYKYGSDAPQLQDYLRREQDYQQFVKHILRGADELEKLYANFTHDTPESVKASEKKALLGHILENMDTLGLANPAAYKAAMLRRGYNNAYFLSYLAYRERQQDLSIIYEQQFDGDLKKFLAYFRKNYPSL